jgi:hypothetical protein
MFSSLDGFNLRKILKGSWTVLDDASFIVNYKCEINLFVFNQNLIF